MKKDLIIAIIMLLLIPEGCKKYEEGPWISCRTKKHRLLGGWALKTFYVNGIDSTSYYNELFHGIFFDYLKKHDSSGRLDKVGSRNYFSMHVNEGYIKGDWDFLDDHKKISLRFVDWGTDEHGYGSIAIEGFGPFGTGKLSKWLIKKLTNDELTIVTIYSLINYEIELEKH